MATMDAVTMSKALASLTVEVSTLKSYISKLESSIHHLLPAKPTVPSPSALNPTPSIKSSSRKGQLAAPISTPIIPTPIAPPPINIATLSNKAAFEKTVITLSIPDDQTGHVVGRAGTGLRQIHDVSHAKVSVAPPSGSSGFRSVTIRGTAREVGDAIVAIGKRLARRRIRTPETQTQKQNNSFVTQQKSPAPTLQDPVPLSTSKVPSLPPPPPTPPPILPPIPSLSSSTPAVKFPNSFSSPVSSPKKNSSYMSVDTHPSSPEDKSAYGSPMQIDRVKGTVTAQPARATARGGPKSARTKR